MYYYQRRENDIWMDGCISKMDNERRQHTRRIVEMQEERDMTSLVSTKTGIKNWKVRMGWWTVDWLETGFSPRIETYQVLWTHRWRNFFKSHSPTHVRSCTSVVCVCVCVLLYWAGNKGDSVFDCPSCRVWQLHYNSEHFRSDKRTFLNIFSSIFPS